MPPTFADFAGTWRLSRRIEDRRAGRKGRMEGRAAFTPEAQTLVYRETGCLELGADRLEAAQSHVWRTDAGQVHVTFSNGAPFHSFALGFSRVSARHDCAPDTYDVEYDFADWPLWTISWRARGPQKDYVSVTRLVPMGEGHGG